MRIITTNQKKNIYKLIRQHKNIDKEAVEIRNKWIDLKNIFIHSIFIIGITLLITSYFYRNLKLFYGVIPILILFLLAHLYLEKIRNKKIYTYNYSQLFPFKVYVSPKNVDSYKNSFIHGKVYIIDDEIVYMGSLNFTYNGTKDNYETRIRTIDKNAILKITEEFNNLFYYSGLPERDIQHWGSLLYHEPIN